MAVAPQDKWVLVDIREELAIVAHRPRGFTDETVKYLVQDKLAGFVAQINIVIEKYCE
jgi:hypothetical protein